MCVCVCVFLYVRSACSLMVDRCYLLIVYDENLVFIIIFRSVVCEYAESESAHEALGALNNAYFMQSVVKAAKVDRYAMYDTLLAFAFLHFEFLFNFAS